MRIFVNKGFFIFVAVLIVLLAVIEHEEPGTVGQMAEDFQQITELPEGATPEEMEVWPAAVKIFYAIVGLILFCFAFTVVTGTGKPITLYVCMAFMVCLLAVAILGMAGVM